MYSRFSSGNDTSSLETGPIPERYTGSALEATPSWISADERSTGDIQVALINDDQLPDLVIGNSGDTSIWVFYNTGEPPIFTDGFESGDTGRWDATAP